MDDSGGQILPVDGSGDERMSNRRDYFQAAMRVT